MLCAACVRLILFISPDVDCSELTDVPALVPQCSWLCVGVEGVR